MNAKGFPVGKARSGGPFAVPCCGLAKAFRRLHASEAWAILKS